MEGGSLRYGTEWQDAAHAAARADIEAEALTTRQAAQSAPHDTIALDRNFSLNGLRSAIFVFLLSVLNSKPHRS